MVDWGALDHANWKGQPSSGPLYQRIVDMIRTMISDGRLVTGDALPTEREFAAMAGVSRGTVSLAYDELKREGIIAAAPGRGSVVTSDRNVSLGSRKEQAIRILTNALERMEALGFSEWEIQAYMHLVLQGRDGHEARVRAAVVDCNPEAVALIQHQLETIAQLDLEPILLEDFLKGDDARLAGFDLFLTTERHAPSVMGHLSRHKVSPERLLSVAVSPSPETLVSLARLPEGSAIAVRTRSARFAEIIQRHLTQLGHEQIRLCVGDELPVAGERVVVPAPAACAIEPSIGLPYPSLAFDYQIDRGSVLRVEEAVTTLLLQKGDGLAPGR